MKRGKPSRVLSFLLACILLFALCLPSFAADGCSITLLSSAPESAEVTQGGLYKLDLSTVFADSEGHSLSYALSGGDFGSQTKITDGTFYFSLAAAGTYTPTLTATCPDGSSASHTMTITVKEAEEGSESQYGYDETPASAVTVYVTINNNGIPIRGNDRDHTILSHLKVTVPYFDLKEYGLADYARYGTENGQGGYVGDTVIERPTLLHLYLYLLERYYMGLAESACCQGTSGVLDYGETTAVYDMNGDLAYESQHNALSLSGSATSMYMTQFWGHDENLMYYRNHVYPLMSAGWGSTADYILLSDEDTIDVGMFSDWSFWEDGAFACFDQDTYVGQAGESVTAQSLKYDTKSVADGGTESFEAVSGLNVALYDSQWKKVSDLEGSEGSYTFPLPDTPGDYYLLGTDPKGGSSDARMTSATALVRVVGEPEPAVIPGDVNGDGQVSNIDAALTYAYFNGNYELTQEQLGAADVNGDGVVTNIDAALIYAFYNGRIDAFS